MIAVIILLSTLCKGKTVIKLNIFDKWLLDKKLLLSISRIGIPAGIEKLIMRAGQLVYGSVIIALGTSSYIAHKLYVYRLGFKKNIEKFTDKHRLLSQIVNSEGKKAVLLICQ